MTADERRISDWSSDVCSSDLITVSSARADKLAGLGIERGRITVLRNGVDPAVFRPVEASGSDSEGSGGVPPPRPLAVSVGNLVPLKGPGPVIAALAVLPGLTFWLGGGGRDPGRLERTHRRASCRASGWQDGEFTGGEAM